MANNNETTTKFKVDISELVSGMQTAKRQISLANAEFKSATAGMDNWSKSADGVSAKLTQLDKTLDNQKKILNNLEDQYALTVKQMGEGSKEAENLKIKIENQKASVAKTQKQIDTYTQSLADIKAEASKSSTALDKLEESISSQESELSDLKTAYANAVVEFGKSSDEAKDLATQIDKLSGDLKDSKTAMNDAKGSADDLDKSLDSLDDSAEGAGDGFTVLKGAMADLVADGIKAVASSFGDLISGIDSGSNIFQAQTGATTEAMDKYNDAIENIYKNNFGESLQDVAEKMAKVKEVTGELDASKLQDLTEKAITLEDTFGMDMTETLRGVQSLVTHFGISSEEAFDLIASGAQNGLNYTDELGDNVSEYAGKFAEAGYSSEEYFQLLKNGSQGGAYNLDKVNDAINEATTRLGDGTIEKDIGSFSQSTQDLFKAWQNGEASQKDVINSIVGDIQGATSEQDKMNLSALAFGTMAEDGGTKFIESLSAVGDSFTDTKGKMDEIKDTRYDDVMSQLSGLGRTIQTDILAPLVEKLLPTLKDGLTWVKENLNTLIPVVVTVGAVMATAFAVGKVVSFVQNIQKMVGIIKGWELATKAQAVAQGILNAVMNANPIGLIIMAIVALVGAFVLLWNKSEAFRNFWIGLWDGIKSITSSVVEAIGGFFSGLWDSITGIFSKLSIWFDRTVIAPIKLLFMSLWIGIKNTFQPAIDWFSELFTSIWNTLESIVTVIIGLLKGCWAIIVRVFEVAGSWFNDNVIQPVAKFFSDLWKKISDGASKAWDFIVGVFKVVSGWFNDNLIKPVSKFFSDMWGKLKDGASDAWSGIKDVFSKVADFFGEIFGNAWRKVKDIFSVGGQIFDGIKDGIVSAFTTVVNAIIRGINKVVKLPFDAINGMLNKIRTTSVLGIEPFKNLWGKNPLSVPVIPELYQGGVLRKGQMGLLEGNGDEAVVPLEHNTGWLDEVASRIISKGGLDGGKPQTINNEYNYEFTQTNNSPKALSRLEIYRQTKNLTTYGMGAI